ncbi:MAG: hypothetical protein KF685_02545 [Acidobacteria bacterium]|nr:hypothetical protein [Acidobacteriota bacterium]
MSNYDQITSLYDRAEKLIGVGYSVFDAGLDGKDWIEAIEMRFETTVATVCVEPDYDTLRVELTEMKVGSDCYFKDATSIKPWVDAVGCTAAWIWLLRNQQGYEDGLRFEFASRKEKGQESTITLIGIASSIKIYISQRIDL